MSLTKYRNKRNFEISPEPAGRSTAASATKKKLLYVIQKHRATQLHYDFRLEYNDVLFPGRFLKGPSLDPSVKRLASRGSSRGIWRLRGRDTGGRVRRRYGDGLGQRRLDSGESERGGGPAKRRSEIHVAGQEAAGVLGAGSNAWLWQQRRSLLALIKHRDAFASTRDIVTEEPRSVQSKRLLADIARKDGGNVEKVATAIRPPK